jgi:hypothetical protein
MHEGAEYNVTAPAAGGSAQAECVHPPCTLGNATIILDSKTNAATVKFTNASTEMASLDAGCSTLSFENQPWSWTNHRESNISRNLDISLGTFLGDAK